MAEPVGCQVYSDGDVRWFGATPTDAERDRIEKVIESRPRPGYVLTLERS